MLRRIPALILFFLLAPVICRAASVTISDPFNAPNYPAAGYDVIGNRQDFDIKSITFDQVTPSRTMDIRIEMNYHTTIPRLAQWTDYGLNLSVGDILFKVGSTYKYGIAVNTHAGSPNGGASAEEVLAGSFYQNATAGGAIDVFSAQNVLVKTSGVFYRFADKVWLNNTGNLYSPGQGAVSVADAGNGTTDAKYLVTLDDVPVTAEFLSDLLLFGIDFQFASATCANDIVRGRIDKSLTPVPEPGTMLLLASGLAGLAGYGRKRMRK